MIAHSIFDVPMTPVWRGVVLAALLIGAVTTWRRAVPILKQVFAAASGTACVALGVVAGGYAILASRDSLPLYVAAAAMVVVAVAIEATDRARKRTKTTASVSV
jgi:CHASE2 domain-containing sensor protein